jgi:hypothetical protein
MSYTSSLDAVSSPRSHPLRIERSSLRPPVVLTEQDQISSLHSKLSDIHEKVTNLAELVDSFNLDGLRRAYVAPQPRRLKLVKRGT